MAEKESGPKKPRTKLNVQELLGDHTASDLASAMGLKSYTQAYQYTKKGANPTLAVMEQIADGLSLLKKREITIEDLVKQKK